mmetsp:Transcript_18477/g.51752  ORF Transcript_18477/g.51752 Transcript_18477/m.51752 type:complete len:280 (+) Transcript_18477:313-1152(+)
MWAQILVAFLAAATATAAVADPMVHTHRHRLHDSAKSNLLMGYDPRRLIGPCSKVECPDLFKEVHLTTIGAALRKYKPAKWLTIGDDGWKFKHVNCIDFREAFMKIIGYQRGNNYSERPIPITTPIVVELFVDSKHYELDRDQRISFRTGFKVYWRLDSSVATDPYAEPTEKDLNIVGWSPTDEDEWVAVHQWTQENLDDSGEMKDLDEKDVILQHATAFLQQLGDAFERVAEVKPVTRRLYYAAWGGPMDRVHEIWVPVSGDALLRGLAVEHSLQPFN